MLELLPVHAVHVDLVATDNTDALELRDQYLALLSAEEHERMARLVFERDRRATRQHLESETPQPAAALDRPLAA